MITVIAATRALRWTTTTTRCATSGFEISHRRAIKFKQLDPRADGGNNRAKLISLIGRTKRNCQSAKACPAGTTNTVNIGFRCVGQIKIDNMAQASNIDTTRGNIGCN
jgi:anti-sigma factor RsiW